jgi:hypothetical protein
MKKITFKTLSILLVAALLVAALPIAVYAEDASSDSSCPHFFQEREYIHYEYQSKSVCLREVYRWEQCVICGITVNYSYDPEPTTHNCETRYKTYYSTHSNEYHTTVEYLEEICLCCGKIINSYEEYFDLECHEFDDSVDPEVDTEGVCILCGDEVSW